MMTSVVDTTDKDAIVEFADTYSIELACERFGIPKQTLKSWMKQNKVPPKPLYNSPGQGRKISYSRELDLQIADHVRSLLNKGDKVSVQDTCAYARKLIQRENPDFSASTGWAQRFLARHNIDLSAQFKKLIPSGRQGNNTTGSSSSDSRGRPLSYSAETDNDIADWVRHRTERGEIVTNSELRKHAKDLIIKENQNFTGSASWAQNFLLRHKLSLQPVFLSPESEKPKPPSLDLAPPISSSSSLPLQLDTSQDQTLVTEDTNGSVPQLVSQALSTSNTGFTANVDDSVTSTLALLAAENIPVEGQLSQVQATALTLSDLTSDAALADLLNSAQDPTGSGFNPAALESSAAYLSLGQHLSDLVGSVASVANGQSVLSGVLGHSPQTVQAASSQPDIEVVGSGTRPLSYTKETDQVLANWVKEQQAAGQKVTFASLRAYAKKLVSAENPNFNASVGWVTPFLLRHNLDLKVNDKRSRPTRKTTHPRKLSSKGEDGPGAEEGEFSGDTPTEEPHIEDGDIEIPSLSIVSSLAQSFTSTDTLDVTAGSIQLVGTPEVALEMQDVKTDSEDFLTPSKLAKLGGRSRHTLAEKLEVVRLMRQYNVAGHYVSRMLGIANSTLSGWIKLVDQKGQELEALSANRKRSNRSGQGRPLTYSREKDEIIASWVRQQQEMGVPVTATDLSNYATTVIGQENQSFVASVGWRHKFLQRHGLQLQQLHASYKSNSSESQQNVPIPVQTEEVCTDEFTVDIVERVYPDEVVQQLTEWVKLKLTEAGSLSVQQFCKKAEELICPLDPLFVATLGWTFKFLHLHNLFLDPKPANVELTRKRPLSTTPTNDIEGTVSKKPCTSDVAAMAAAIGVSPESLTVSPSTGNLCEALLSLSSQSGQEEVVMTTPLETTPLSNEANQSNSKTYFGKSAREFSLEEKEEVVRYANATTLQKAAMKYCVAAPTVWRWRMELKLHQPKYTANQKKYIVKFAETNSLKEAAQRFGITTKTIQNWRRALQMDGTLSDVEIAAIPPPALQELTGDGEGLTTPTASGGLITEEVIPLDNSHFQYVVDGGEVAEGARIQSHAPLNATPTSPLEVTHEVQVQDVGMEYDVISSEGHAAKPRCTPEEKMHILQYALEHSIREASVKYGVSPGTLYYWKKNHLSTQAKGPGSVKGKPSLENSLPQMTTSLETTVVSVPMPVDIVNGTSLMQPHPSVTPTDPLQALAADASILGDPHSSVPTSSLINAITQTLASATPEQLQSLQQITSDLNLLQAVTSLINSHEASQLRQTTPTDLIQRRESVSGGISSPTEVLVSFNPLSTLHAPNHQPDAHISVEEVTMTTGTNDISQHTLSDEDIPLITSDKQPEQMEPSPET